jgi:hypothetical protein
MQTREKLEGHFDKQVKVEEQIFLVMCLPNITEFPIKFYTPSCINSYCMSRPSYMFMNIPLEMRRDLTPTLNFPCTYT